MAQVFIAETADEILELFPDSNNKGLLLLEGICRDFFEEEVDYSNRKTDNLAILSYGVLNDLCNDLKDTGYEYLYWVA
jgi:hypothetical protein